MTHEPTELIEATRLGRTFRASRRTLAHIDFTIAAFERTFPDASLVIVQTCYNTGVPASAGTHDYDACLDFWFTGRLCEGTTKRQGYRLQRFLRAHGWGAWFRHTGAWAAKGLWHCHGFSIPENLRTFATKVGEFIDGGLQLFGKVEASSQLADYFNHAEGLAGEHIKNEDRSWFPESIKSTVFYYAQWMKDRVWDNGHTVKAPKAEHHQSTAPETTKPQERTYEVKAGDSLYTIAEQVYGDGMLYQQLGAANGIGAPWSISVGQKLVIPPK